MFLSYRDPLFGIIVFFILLFGISLISHFFILYKEKKARTEYRKLLRRFQFDSLKEEDYIHLYQTYNLSFDSILLLAFAFVKKGDYNKAISVYLALLDVVENKVHKEELLELLGGTYFKGGFLQRSKDIFLKILKFSPRNRTALYNLLLIYENLKDYNGASNVIEVLDELSTISKDEKIYINILKIISNSNEEFEVKSKKLLDILNNYSSVQKLIAIYFVTYNKILFWENISKFDLDDIKDLLWYFEFNDIDFDKVLNNKFLIELYTAKGYIKEATSSDIFELDILIKLNSIKSNNLASLTFGFTCNKCKKNHPVFISRCPNCHGILTLKSWAKISKPVTYNISSYM
jgi:lipopolysaccharide assembly protein B